MTDHKLPPNLGEAALQGVEDVASLVAEVQRLKMALQNIANTLDSADDASMRVAHRMAKGMALTAVSATPARPTSAQRPPPSVSLPRPMVQRPDTSLPPPVASDDPFAATTPLPFPASSVSEVAAPMAPMAYEARRPAASQSPGDTQPGLPRFSDGDPTPKPMAPADPTPAPSVNQVLFIPPSHEPARKVTGIELTPVVRKK